MVKSEEALCKNLLDIGKISAIMFNNGNFTYYSSSQKHKLGVLILACLERGVALLLS